MDGFCYVECKFEDLEVDDKCVCGHSDTLHSVAALNRFCLMCRCESFESVLEFIEKTDTEAHGKENL